jgi:hypothetical protein
MLSTTIYPLPFRTLGQWLEFIETTLMNFISQDTGLIKLQDYPYLTFTELESLVCQTF